MSWYIQQLLRNSVEIETRADLDADDFNDLIIIKKKIKELHSDGIVSDQELELLKYIEDGKPISNSKEGFGRNRISLSRDFVGLCNKIAFYAGGYFTDDGYIHYMRTKYSLSDEDVKTLENYMSSKYKNKLMRKQKQRDEKQ